MPVPAFKQLFPSVHAMNQHQREFYIKWLTSWGEGRSLDIEGNISYLFCYIYKLLEDPSELVVNELGRIRDSYSHVSDKIPSYCNLWIADCYVVMGDYATALTYYPKILLNGRNAYGTDQLLSLKLAVGKSLSGKDAITLFGPGVTRWCREHLQELSYYLEAFIRSYEDTNGVDLLESWSKRALCRPYFVFSGAPLWRRKDIEIKEYFFHEVREAQRLIKSMARAAENEARTKYGIPKVGEGWVSETNLYYEVKKNLPEYRVIFHASPPWLCRQHLDIFIPEISVAIEYQGGQHLKPVEFFGGAEAFEKLRKRDRRKKVLCTKNGVRLIYVYEGYSIDAILSEILDKSFLDNQGG